MGEPGRMLGVDYGRKRVGIAVSDPTGLLARGLDTLINDQTLIPKILDYVTSMAVVRIVVGKPLKLSGQEGISAVEASRFAQNLRDRLGAEGRQNVVVVEWDERFTTTIAQRIQIELGIKKKDRQKKSNLDRMASQLILQSYLDSHQGSGGTPRKDE